ncbi:MAG TPA: ferrous iron transport protein A [Candidatus Ornithoclostridium excrementipullorum]|nr:ferrous iron transport protein A [Candidatus Ornithoclostridium excrementipullorum]
MESRLDKLRPGQKGVVVSIDGDGKVKRRLFDMGLTPDAEVMLRKVAPLGDPIEVTLRGYELSLRKAEAHAVVLEV